MFGFYTKRLHKIRVQERRKRKGTRILTFETLGLQFFLSVSWLIRWFDFSLYQDPGRMLFTLEIMYYQKTKQTSVAKDVKKSELIRNTVGMYKSVAIMENSVEMPPKIKNRTTM